MRKKKKNNIISLYNNDDNIKNIALNNAYKEQKAIIDYQNKLNKLLINQKNQKNGINLSDS